MKCLNSLYRVACLQCSFKELGKYIQYKKRNIIQLSKKFAVIIVGQQPDGLWVTSNLPDDSSDRLEKFTLHCPPHSVRSLQAVIMFG